ncbi:MAG TPA: hypothetical protein VIC53_01290 [Wenzhouxiangella sp.]
MMTAAAATLNNALATAQEAVSNALTNLLNWAQAIPQDFWIITTFSLLGLVLIVVGIALTRPAAHKTRRAHTEGAAPDAQMQSPQSSPTHAAEAQAALAQALDANEHHQEQIQALKNDLDHWATSLSSDLGDAATDAWLANIKDALNQAHGLVQALHQTAKTHQLNTINQSLDGSEATLDGASKALLDTMADWLKHHQNLYEQLEGIDTPLKSLKARQESPGSVRHAATLEQIEAQRRTLNGLERSLHGLGQDLKRIEQLMLGGR